MTESHEPETLMINAAAPLILPYGELVRRYLTAALAGDAAARAALLAAAQRANDASMVRLLNPTVPPAPLVTPERSWMLPAIVFPLIYTLMREPLREHTRDVIAYYTALLENHLERQRPTDTRPRRALEEGRRFLQDQGRNEALLVDSNVVWSDALTALL